MFLTPSPIADLLILAIVALMGGHTVYLVSKKRFQVLDPLVMFWAGVIVVYVMQPMSEYANVAVRHRPGAIDLTLFWSLVGFMSVVLGYELKLGVRLGLKVPSLPAQLSEGRLLLAGWMLVLVGIAGYLAVFALSGGFSQWISSSRGGTYFDVTGVYLATAPELLPAGILLLAFTAEYGRWQLPWRILVWVGGIAPMWWWYVYLGTRSRTISFLLGSIAAYYLPRRRNPPLWLLVPTFAMLVVLTEFQGHYRGNFYNLSFHLSDIDWAEARDACLPKFLTKAEHKPVSPDEVMGVELNCATTAVEVVPSEVDFNYGVPIVLDLFLRPIPRMLWPDKRYPRGEAQSPIMAAGNLSTWEVGNPEFPFLAGPTLTFTGFWWAVAGPVGIIVGGLGVGVALRLMRTFYSRDPGNMGNAFLFAATLQIGFLEAAFEPLTWVFSLPLLVLPLIVLVFLCRQRSPELMSPWATADAGALGD